MNTYRITALAVGGAAAGEMLTGEGRWTVRAAAEANACLRFTCDSPMDLDTIQHFEYRRVELAYALDNGERREFTFWVAPDEIKNQHDLFSALINGYRPVVSEMA